jgi:hypothetical protein
LAEFCFNSTNHLATKKTSLLVDFRSWSKTTHGSSHS